ncbi:MAG: type I-E CRISPR-associated protein Cse1/CasA [Chloroflexi bacterium]|nr:type I-E CRISPR-associated protein Cse1/CasA [Chloroflexota bacterium]
MTYNLLDEPWIPVLYTNGTACRVGIKNALTQAGRIRQIAASNPMDRVAIMRFLLAVLYWCKGNPTTDAAPAPADSFPEDWFSKLYDNRDCFNLLGGGKRFYQSSDEADKNAERPASDLFAYLPAATEINHFQHVYDRTVGLCRACCALGLVRLSACATQGGQGKSPSINNAPPAYFLPRGNTLMETLLLNWPSQELDDDYPSWDMGKQAQQSIGILEGFTWQPRAVWLGPLIQIGDRRCSRCGAQGPLVSKLVFKGGRSRSGDRRAWRDPLTAQRPTKAASNADKVGNKDNLLRGPDPVRYPSYEAAFWRELARAMLQSASGDGPVPAIRVAGQRLSYGTELSVTCYEPLTKQAKTFDEHGDTWKIAYRLLEDVVLRDLALAEIDGLDDMNLRYYIVQAIPRQAQGRPEVKSALAMVDAEIEATLRTQFRRFLDEITVAVSREEVDRRVEGWRHGVRDAVRAVLNDVSSMVAAGSPLRQREATQKALRALHRAMERPANATNLQPIPRAVQKPKGAARKRGAA